jgi:hypothetical protein
VLFDHHGESGTQLPLPRLLQPAGEHVSEMQSSRPDEPTVRKLG